MAEIVAAGVAEVVGIDRDGLGPAEGRRADQDEHEGQDDRADGVDMDQGIEADPAQVEGGRVAGVPSVRLWGAPARSPFYVVRSRRNVTWRGGRGIIVGRRERAGSLSHSCSI